MMLDSFWPVFFGHIIALSGQAFLKNPVSKLATNWFGDKERGFATGLGIMSGPSGIFISKILIMTIMQSEDRDPNNQNIAEEHYETFIIVNTIIVVILTLPALILIRDKPPSPPSIVATVPRPTYTFRQAVKLIFTNWNYVLVFINYQLVNTVAIYGGEITTFLKPYPQYDLTSQNVASMLNCFAGIGGSLALGKIIDKHRCMRQAQIWQSVVVCLFILFTYILLNVDCPIWFVIIVITLAGAPMSTISVVSYQFAAEVIYPVNEVFGIGIMNTINKIFTFIVVLISSVMGSNESLIFWACLSILGVIPAYLVKEDFRRLNMKDVGRSQYLFEGDIVKKTYVERGKIMADTTMIIDIDMFN